MVGFRNNFMFDVDCGCSIGCYQPKNGKKIFFQQKKYCAHANGQYKCFRQVRNSDPLGIVGIQNVFRKVPGIDKKSRLI